MVPPLLNINPSQLEFLFEADKELKSALNIRNVHDDTRAAFKIKTTNLERFIVSPPFGIIEPGSSKLVKVYLKAQGVYTDDLRFCKDCFLIQSIAVDDSATDIDVTSDLFRSQQRQEARMRVVVAAPLAHGKILEHEIKDIARNQGVEGHRAVARKFAELLLAKGIISQAQVALAFSTVGELFQDLQDLPQVLDSASEQFRKSNSQTFLEGRTGLMTELTASSSELGLNEWNSMPQSRRYDASKAATFRSVQHLNGSQSPHRSMSNSHADNPNGESIISALTSSTENVSSPWMRRMPDLRASLSTPQARSPLSVDDKAEVHDRGDQAGSQAQRNLSFGLSDEAVNKAFPDDMYSQQLANGLPDYASNPASTHSSPMARERRSEFMPSLDSDITPRGARNANPLFSVHTAPSEELGLAPVDSPSEPQSPDSRNPFQSAVYGLQDAPSPSKDELSRSPAGLSQQALGLDDQALNAMPAPLLPVDDSSDTTREGPTESASRLEPDIAEAGDQAADERATPIARQASEVKEEEERLSLGESASQSAQEVPSVAPEKPKLTSPASLHQESSTSEGTSGADGPQRHGSKGVRSPTPDSMGRTSVFTIDRLATPAIRKPALPTGIRQDGLTSPGRPHSASSANTTSPPRLVSPRSQAGDKGHVTEAPDFSSLHLDIRDTDAEREARDGQDGLSPSSRDVQIPSGNTMQMAKFWDARTRSPDPGQTPMA